MRSMGFEPTQGDSLPAPQESNYNRYEPQLGVFDGVFKIKGEQ
jgi:hypothetical protein